VQYRQWALALLIGVVAGTGACGDRTAPDNDTDTVGSGPSSDTVAALPAGDGEHEPPVALPSATSAPAAGPLSGLPPNELGEIMVLEYHRLGEHGRRVGASAENFQRDLETLYARGYRPVLMRDVVRGHIDVPAGTTPVVFTIDDSRSASSTCSRTAASTPTR
jgi:hypothetical protein